MGYVNIDAMSEDTEWKTIRVPKGVYDDAKARKEEHGVTWGEYVNPHAWHSVFDSPKETPGNGELVTVDAETDIPEVKDDLENIQRMLESAQESWEYLNGEEIHGTVHESDHELKDVLNRLDDLESRLPRKVAEELR